MMKVTHILYPLLYGSLESVGEIALVLVHREMEFVARDPLSIDRPILQVEDSRSAEKTFE